MGIGTSNTAAKTASVFVDLKTNAQKGAEGVGFRQETGRQTDGDGKVHRSFALHNYVSGHIQGFKAKEEPTYDDPNKSEWIGYLTLSEQGEPNVVVRFPMERASGRRLVGLVNAAVQRGDDTVFLRTTFSEAGTKLGDLTLEKNQAFLTMRAGDAQGEKLAPLYLDANGSPMVDGEGNAASLPKAEKVKVGRTEVLDSSAADEIVLNTAASLMEHFEALRQARKDDQSDGDINPAEAAAAAAAPRG